MSEHIVAVFETEADATDARRSLESLGISAAAIRQYAGSEQSARARPAAETTTAHSSGGGFWPWLFGDEETTSESYGDDIYDRRTAAGNVVVSVTVDDAMIARTIDALDAHHPLDIDEHSTDAAAIEGSSSMAPMTMTGPSTTGQEFSSAGVARAGLTEASTPTGRVGVDGGPRVPVPPGSSPSSTDMSTGGTAREEVIPLSEEELRVGKRTVDRGTTRIRRYVVEKPVEQDVNLQSEKVTVERRQPIGTTAGPGAGAFAERVVEVRETAEEPVVSKTAHVAEEVVVGRETTERTETVRDTVRREDVEISGDDTAKR
jgi:uncharacterized protein (TIGR02271 family)